MSPILGIQIVIYRYKTPIVINTFGLLIWVLGDIMAGQKRKELLTKTERERLITRRDMEDSKKRIANDARVKKKLSAWLNNLEDVSLILDNLPEEISSSAIEEINIYELLNIVGDSLKIKQFRKISGDAAKIDTWQTAPSRQAEELDIARTSILAIFFTGLSRYLTDNPTLKSISLLPIYIDSSLRDRLTDDEKRAVERCIVAVKEIYGFDLMKTFERPPE